MTRQKVKLAFITNDSARKATYKKRKRGLIKKVNELSTLCGVDACAIVYSPYESQPEVWPPSAIAVQRVLGQFRRMPEMEQSKKMVNQETFLRQRISKTKEQLKKQLKDNREKEMTEVMFQCLAGKGMMNLNMMDLNDLAWLIDQNLREIDNRCEKLIKKSEGNLIAGQMNNGATTAGLVVEDTKPPIRNMNNPMVNNIQHACGSFGVNGMQTGSASSWFSAGLMNSNGALSSSNNQPLGAFPGMANDMMLAPPGQFNMGGGGGGGVWPNNPKFYNN
ncbi:unnamed protein product [Rhodiola kirilowii]